MKLFIVKPDIDKFEIRMERSDPLYSRCMWADITFDYDAYSISALTDCGNYAYWWPKTDRESFRNLCLRMLNDDEYLLGKFARQDRFDLEESKILFRDMNEDDPELVARVMAEDGIDNDREWVEVLEGLDVTEPWEYIVRNYSYGARTFVSLLTDIVLPAMKARKDATHGIDSAPGRASWERTSPASWQCSVCRAGYRWNPERPKARYCYNCGAKMEKEAPRD